MQHSTERQSWLTRVRDSLNSIGVMVAACDLGQRPCGEVVAAEQWAKSFRVAPPMLWWIGPFVRQPGESTIETRRRARAELRLMGPL